MTNVVKRLFKCAFKDHKFDPDKDLEYELIDDKLHKESRECIVCGSRVVKKKPHEYEYNYSSTDESSHKYIAKCACGHTIEGEGPHEADESRNIFIPLDATHHYVKKLCKDCGMQITEKEEHKWAERVSGPCQITIYCRYCKFAKKTKTKHIFNHSKKYTFGCEEYILCACKKEKEVIFEKHKYKTLGRYPKKCEVLKRCEICGDEKTFKEHDFALVEKENPEEGGPLLRVFRCRQCGEEIESID